MEDTPAYKFVDALDDHDIKWTMIPSIRDDDSRSSIVIRIHKWKGSREESDIVDSFCSILKEGGYDVYSYFGSWHEKYEINISGEGMKSLCRDIISADESLRGGVGTYMSKPR